MNQAEVTGPEVKGDSGLQVHQLFREGQGKPMKSSNLHSERQILAFHVGRTDFTVIRSQSILLSMW